MKHKISLAKKITNAVGLNQLFVGNPIESSDRLKTVRQSNRA